MKALRAEPGDPPELVSAKYEALIVRYFATKMPHTHPETFPELYDLMRHRLTTAAASFDPSKGCSLTTWLYRAVQAAAGDSVKNGDRRRRTHDRYAADRDRRLAGGPTQAQAAGLAADVAAAIGKLPAAHRPAIRAWLAHGCDGVAAGKSLGLGRAAVSHHVRKAYPLLRRLLSAYDPKNK